MAGSHKAQNPDKPKRRSPNYTAIRYTVTVAGSADTVGRFRRRLGVLIEEEQAYHAPAAITLDVQVAHGG